MLPDDRNVLIYLCPEQHDQNKIASVDASIIANVLNNNTTLELFNLSDNLLCNMGVTTFAKTFSINVHSMKMFYFLFQLNISVKRKKKKMFTTFISFENVCMTD